jgi:hypothetical protein
MITEEILAIHDELEAKASVRPWVSSIRKRPGYGKLLFWSRRPDLEVIFDRIDDAKYLTFIRNVAPELVYELRKERKMNRDMIDMIAELHEELSEFRRLKKNP